MLVSVISLLAVASAVSAQSSTAPVVSSNPVGAKYVATLPEKEGSSLTGSIEGTTGPDGKGVKFAVSFAGLPAEGGPFLYHLHAKPVPEDGNCTGTGAHLDPYMRGEDTPCDASMPETCQTGDLSGKYGKIPGQSFSEEYVDLYSATLPSDPAFFGSLSFVVHLANKTRIGCANFHMVADGEDEAPKSSGYPTMPSATASSGYAMPSGSSMYNSTTVVPSATTGMPMVPSSTSSTPAEFSGAAAQVVASAGVLLAAAAALVL